MPIITAVFVPTSRLNRNKKILRRFAKRRKKFLFNLPSIQAAKYALTGSPAVQIFNFTKYFINLIEQIINLCYSVYI
jgi:hypothetical protein